ncbi:MAG: hypothetical protein HOV81_17865 [Kofleriaceae bacterium]|nr:hypothetical protein [Kofleriaceae bacterium]
MNEQRRQLLAALAERGWTEPQPLDTQWWADEMLVLTSTWSPVGQKLFVTFLVDPQHDGPRAKGEHVWAVQASTTQPLDRRDKTGPVLSVGRGWLERLPELLHAIDRFRASSSPNEDVTSRGDREQRATRSPGDPRSRA